MWWTILQGKIYLQKMDDNNGKHCFDVLIGKLSAQIPGSASNN